MAPLKSPNGFSTYFYQKYWSTVGDEVCAAVLSCLNLGRAIEIDTINDTYIVLIPKIKHPLRDMDFRPIIMCNMVYKLLSKVLANRLKKMLPNIISQNQSAFIYGRLITDNILAAYETLHTMNTHLKGKISYMALKLDMRKACDWVK